MLLWEMNNEVAGLIAVSIVDLSIYCDYFSFSLLYQFYYCPFASPCLAVVIPLLLKVLNNPDNACSHNQSFYSTG